MKMSVYLKTGVSLFDHLPVGLAYDLVRTYPWSLFFSRGYLGICFFQMRNQDGRVGHAKSYGNVKTCSEHARHDLLVREYFIFPSDPLLLTFAVASLSFIFLLIFVCWRTSGTAFLSWIGSTKPLLRLRLETIASLKHSLSFSSMFFDASRSTLNND